jgi:late competence protein required for DNA uptake (superfamily II DNA/RNA helicase)
VAQENIEKCLAEKQVCLLHGITSSGKTHVYIKLIEQFIRKGTASFVYASRRLRLPLKLYDGYKKTWWVYWYLSFKI